MVQLFVEASKYVILVLFALYTLSCILVFAGKRNKDLQEAIYLLQRFVMFLFHFLTNLVLFLTTKEGQVLAFYIAQVVLFAVIIAIYMLYYKRASELVLNNMIMLLMLGLTMLTRLSFDKAIKQFIFLVAGMTIALIIPQFLKLKSVFRKFTWVYAGVGIVLLALVAVFGKTDYGAKLSIGFGSFSIQPSEFVKIIFVFFLASMLQKKKSFLQVLLTSVISAVFVLILVASKDLGGAFIYYTCFLVIIYVATGQLLYFIGGLGIMSAAAVAGYKLFPHVRTRVSAWIDPLSSVENQGYQVSQSLFGIGTGGWFGLGLNQGIPEKIPVVTKDFIFSAICEEFGAIFGICLILICATCYIMIINSAMRMKDRFYKLVAVGLGTLYATQVFLTIGGTIKFIPLTGVTLPLVSYGGSSLLSTLIIFGLIQGLYILPNKKGNSGSAEDAFYAEDRVLNKTARRPIRVIGYLFIVLFISMVIYLVYFMNALSAKYINNPYNKVEEVLAEKITRGEIRAADGTVLAYTQTDKTGEEVRVYPYNRVFSHVVGISTYGKTGIEAIASKSLLTSHTSISEKTQNTLNEQKQVGDNVVTTLDFKLQNAAFEAMSGYNGAIMVIEPKTGKVLAMVSKPDYNPNTIVEDWDTITADEDNSVLVNRATQGKYAPGSTFKMFTTLAYIRQNPNTFNDYSFNCNSKFTFDDVTIHCAKNMRHGSENLQKSFANSCNCSFSNLANTLNIDKYNKTCEDLLFNKELPMDYQTVKSVFHLSEDEESGTIMRTAIGQGDTLISPLHLLMLASAVDNNGVLMKPYLVDRVENYRGDLVTQNQPEKYGALMTEYEASVMQMYMKSVVDIGTGKKLNKTSYDNYGKTGTAQVSDTTDQENAWYVGYAKKDGYNDVAIAVVIEEAPGSSGYAIPIAKLVLDAYFE